MDFFMIVALISGVVLGCGFALMVVGKILKASNKIGDSKGDFVDFAGSPMHFLSKRNL